MKVARDIKEKTKIAKNTPFIKYVLLEVSGDSYRLQFTNKTKSIAARFLLKNLSAGHCVTPLFVTIKCKDMFGCSSTIPIIQYDTFPNEVWLLYKHF